MTLEAYYRRALLVPIALPAALLPLLRHEPLMETPAGRAVTLLAYSLLAGGAQYAAFALLFARWMRGRSDREILRGVWLSPLVFLVFLLPPWLVIEARVNPAAWRERFENAVLILGGMGLLFGYAYVLAAGLVMAFLRRGGRIAPVPAEAR